MDGLGRRGEGGMAMRRWAERARGARRAVMREMVEVVERCILVVMWCGGGGGELVVLDVRLSWVMRGGRVCKLSRPSRASFDQIANDGDFTLL